MELDRIGPDDAGDDINQFQPWVHREISSEYSVLVVELNTIVTRSVKTSRMSAI